MLTSGRLEDGAHPHRAEKTNDHGMSLCVLVWWVSLATCVRVRALQYGAKSCYVVVSLKIHIFRILHIKNLESA